MGINAGRNPQQNCLRLAVLRGYAVEKIELIEIVDDDTADPRGKRRAQFLRRLVVAVKVDLLSRESSPQRTASSPPETTSSPKPSSSAIRAMAILINAFDA
jgi:hypothetical protein